MERVRWPDSVAPGSPRSSPPGGSVRPEPVADVLRSDMDKAEVLVAELLTSGPHQEGTVVARLQSMGDAALPAVARTFPGRLWFDRSRPHARRPLARELSAHCAALVAYGSSAVPYVRWLLSSREATTRYCAAVVSAELAAPELCAPLGRLLIDPEPDVRAVAAECLEGFRGRAPLGAVLSWLRALVNDTGAALRVRRNAVDALWRLRDAEAVPELARALGDRDPELARLSREALVVITGHDYGPLRLAWAPWLRRHRNDHRIEWLIDGLSDRKPHVRESALQELIAMAGQDLVPWNRQSGRSQWKLLQSTWRSWWEQTGRCEHKR